MLKYSRQREAIQTFLRTRQDHPTAETIYENIRLQYPNISLGTVYRNLALLSQLGMILRISTENGTDRFDPNPTPHYHFTCEECGRVDDLPVSNMNFINEIAQTQYQGIIKSHQLMYYGLCPDCCRKKN